MVITECRSTLENHQGSESNSKKKSEEKTWKLARWNCRKL